MILVIIVAIVVTVVSYGTASEAGWAMVAGTSAAGTGAAGTAVGMGLAAAAGSAASQLVAMAIGQQDQFSWSGVAISALSAGVTQGLMGNVAIFGSGREAAQAWYNAAAQGAISNAAVQGASILMGVQKSFNWSEVAISAVSAPLSRKAGEWTGDALAGTAVANTPGAVQMGVNLAQGVSSGLVRSAMGGKTDYASIVYDAFGRTVANSLVARSDELSPVQITAQRVSSAANDSQLTNNPSNGVFSGSVVSPDEMRAAANDSSPIQEVQITAQRVAAMDEVLVSASRMTEQEKRAYDAGEALRMMRSVAQSSAYGHANQPTGTMQGLSSFEGFSTFNGFGRALSGLAQGVSDLVRSPITVSEGISNLLSDAYGYAKDALVGPRQSILGDEVPYQAQSGLVSAIQQRGGVEVAGDLLMGTLKSLPILGQLDAMMKGDPYAFGASVPNALLALEGGALLRSGTLSTGALISDVRAISAADANAPFLARGWDAPYSYGSQARTFTTASDLDFVRVTTTRPEGAFLVRPGEIAGMSPEQVQVHLALPQVPTSILDVRVPAGTRMQTGFVGPQPSFGVTTRGGIQYQLLDEIPSSSFGPMRPFP
jgi:hypothetical protein